MFLSNALHNLLNTVTARPLDASNLGSAAAWNKVHPASDKPQSMTIPNTIPNEIPYGPRNPKTGIQETANRSLMALLASQPHVANIPYDMTGTGGNQFHAPMQPTYMPIQQARPYNFGDFTPENIQGVQNPGFIPAQGSRGVQNIQQSSRQAPRIVF